MMIKTVPLIRVTNMKLALSFYTGVLDFAIAEADATENDWVILLVNGEVELMLTILEGDQKLAIATNILVNDIDSLFKKYLSRGLDTTGHYNSPVHRGPTDQSWGTREFYVTDRDGNTLRFVQR
jgi:catechol 2,3-dioxygenase-like lactoylglutathione lyase family enzyme